MRSLILSILSLFASVFANAQESLHLSGNGVVDVGFEDQVSFYLDQGNRYLGRPETLLLQEFTQNARPVPLNLGYSDDALWLRFRVEFEGLNGRPVLSMRQSSLNRVTLYQITNGKAELISKAGGSIPIEGREFNTLGIHLRMGMHEGGAHEYLLCVEPMGGILDASFAIHHPSHWVGQRLTPALVFQGFFFGLLLALMLSNGVTFFLTRQSVHLCYVSYVTCVMGLVANFEGILDWIVPWPALGGWLYLSPLFSNLTVITLFLMLKSFFETDQRFPLISRSFNGVILFNIGIGLLNVFGQRRWAHQIIDVQVVPLTILIMSTAFHVWRQGFRPALYMIVARLAMLSLTIIFVLKVYNLAPSNLFTEHAYHLGTMLEMVIVYCGLAIRMKTVEDEKVTAENNERQATVRLDWFNTLVRVITHDMSTPISVISTSVDLELRRQQPSSSLKRNLERIQRSVNQQSDLVGHVREMIAVTTGKKTLNRVPIHVQKKLEGLLVNFAERLEAKQLNVQLEMPPEALYVLAESTALEHTILGNFMSNAIKFSQKGSVIRLRLTRDQKDLIIRFEDQGIGIPADLVEKLFDPTKATSRPGTSNETGTGFGLPIARVYIEQFSGVVTVQSQVAESSGRPSGTSFEIRFPICEAAPEAPKQRISA